MLETYKFVLDLFAGVVLALLAAGGRSGVRAVEEVSQKRRVRLLRRWPQGSPLAKRTSLVPVRSQEASGRSAGGFSMLDKTGELWHDSLLSN
jgi:hypothetical protein